MAELTILPSRERAHGNESCATCMFWRPLAKDSTSGECRIDPPQLFEMQGRGLVTMWPAAEAGDWCGEYERVRRRHHRRRQRRSLLAAKNRS